MNKMKKLFRRTDTSNVIDQAIHLAFEYKKKKSFPVLRDTLSIILKKEVLQNYKNITPILLYYAMKEDLPLFRIVVMELCTKATTKDIKNLIIDQFDQETTVFIIKELIYLCKIEKKILKLFSTQILNIVFTDLFKKLIGREPLTECSLDHLDQNLYILYSVLHPLRNINKIRKTPSIQIQKWYQRVTKDPEKLNQFYLSAFEQNYQKQIYSIKDTKQRMSFLMKLRTPELALMAKKKIFLENKMKDSYFM